MATTVVIPTPGTTLKVNRAISGATTVAATGYAVVDYILSNTNLIGGASRAAGYVPVLTRYFGPSQSIPASFTGHVGDADSSALLGTYSLLSGVEFINSP